VSQVAGLSAVREWLLDVQRDAAEKGGLVADGRDMGTVVFPNAAVKVFLVAGIEERARRRLLQESGNEPSLSEIRAQAKLIERRDRADSGREHAPLRCPEGALELDTTDLTFEGQVALILQYVKDLTLL
jgi:cytidylate kinase